MMTACPSCGAPAGAEDRFCGRCGSSLDDVPQARPSSAGFCSSCGAALEVDDRFCGRCGRPVRTSETAAPIPVDQGDEVDFLADWDLEVPDDEQPKPSRHEAVTEQVPLPPPPADTAVIEQQPVAPPVPYVPLPPPAREQREPARGFPLGATFALIGAVAVIVSAILEWSGPFGEDLPRDIAFRLLFDPRGPATGPNLGVVLLAVGTLGALVALLTMAVPLLTPARRLVGLATLAIPAGFAVRTVQLGLSDGSILDVPSLLGPGFYVALAGSIVQLVAGRWSRR